MQNISRSASRIPSREEHWHAAHQLALPTLTTQFPHFSCAFTNSFFAKLELYDYPCSLYSSAFVDVGISYIGSNATVTAASSKQANTALPSQTERPLISLSRANAVFYLGIY